MIPRILIDSAEIPGGGELRLIRRGDEFSIMLGGNELMNRYMIDGLDITDDILKALAARAEAK